MSKNVLYIMKQRSFLVRKINTSSPVLREGMWLRTLKVVRMLCVVAVRDARHVSTFEYVKPCSKGRDVAEDSQGGAYVVCCGSKRCKTCVHI